MMIILFHITYLVGVGETYFIFVFTMNGSAIEKNGFADWNLSKVGLPKKLKTLIKKTMKIS